MTAASAVLVVAAAERFGGADRVGVLYAAVGAGGLLASAAAMRHGSVRVMRSTLVAGALAEIVLLAILTLSRGLLTAMLCVAASAAAGALYQVWGATELQLRASPEVLGRASAALVGAQYAGMILGALAATVLVPLIGWDHALFTACCVGLGAVAATATGTLRETAAQPVV